MTRSTVLRIVFTAVLAISSVHASGQLDWATSEFQLDLRSGIDKWPKSESPETPFFFFTPQSQSKPKMMLLSPERYLRQCIAEGRLSQNSTKAELKKLLSTSVFFAALMSVRQEMWHHPRFYLYNSVFADLGCNPRPADLQRLPTQFTALHKSSLSGDRWRNAVMNWQALHEPRIRPGRYYVVMQATRGGHYFVLHVVRHRLSAWHREHGNQHFSSSIIQAKYEMTVRWFGPTRTIADLQGAFRGAHRQDRTPSGAPAHGRAPDAAAVAPVIPHPNRESAGKPEVRGQLLATYESVQEQTKDFFDLPHDKVSTAACEALMEQASSIERGIEKRLSDLNGHIRSGTAQTADLRKSLRTTTNIQIADRTKTLISRIEQDVKGKESEARSWTGRFEEIGKSIESLREYMRVLQILEQRRGTR